ncbi:DNA polymerase III subunit beta [bacterium]|nr:DNA polymerase III subunit beta [bacterium]
MEIIVNSTKIKKTLDKINNILPTKPALMITSGILIEAKEEGVSCVSTDLENTIRVNMECQVVKTGSVVISGKKLVSLIRQLPDGEVKISEKDNIVEIKCQGSKYSFIVMDYNEFPKFPQFLGEVAFKVDGSKLKKAIGKTKFCIDADEPRAHFRGGLLDIKEDSLNLIATDTKRLSIFKILSETEYPEPCKCLLPFKLINVLPSLIGEEIVDINIGKNQISFKYEDTYLVAQLLSGSEDFPDYEKVIPDETKQKVALIQKDNFIGTLKRISLFTSERYNKVKISFGKNVAIFSVVSPDVGEAQEKLDIEYNEQEQVLAFPPSHLLEFVQLLDGEKVRVGFVSEKAPVLMRDGEEDNYLYVAMPLKLE